MFSRIDSCAIDLVLQPFSWKVQRITGVTCIGLASVAYACVTIFLVLAALYAPGPFRGPFWAVALIYAGFYLFRAVPFLKEKEQYLLKTGAVNHTRVTAIGARRFAVGVTSLIFFILAPVVARGLWEVPAAFMGACTALTLMVYLMSCTPLPPAKSKLRKLKERLLSGSAHAPKPGTVSTWQKRGKPRMDAGLFCLFRFSP